MEEKEEYIAGREKVVNDYYGTDEGNPWQLAQHSLTLSVSEDSVSGVCKCHWALSGAFTGEMDPGEITEIQKGISHDWVEHINGYNDGYGLWNYLDEAERSPIPYELRTT